MTMTMTNTVVNFQFFNSHYSASNRQPSAAIDDCVDRMLHRTLSLYPIDELVSEIHRRGVDKAQEGALAEQLTALHEKCRARGIFVEYLIEYELSNEFGQTHTTGATCSSPKGLKELMRDLAYDAPSFKGIRLWFDGGRRGKEYIGESDILSAWLDGEEVVFSLRMTRHGRTIAQITGRNWFDLRIETSHCLCRAMLDGLL